MNINTAKALLAVIKTSDASREHDRVRLDQGACLMPSLAPTRRYVATNGHVLLCIERQHTRDEVDNEPSWSKTYSRADLKEYVASKGYSTLTNASNAYSKFPDWESCIPSKPELSLIHI